jgi:hypothetical protein
MSPQEGKPMTAKNNHTTCIDRYPNVEEYIHPHKAHKTDGILIALAIIAIGMLALCALTACGII